MGENVGGTSEGYVLWVTKTVTGKPSAFDAVNLQLLLSKAPRVTSETRKVTVIRYFGVHVIRHGRKKVKNKKVFRLYKAFLAHFGQYLREHKLVCQYEVVCDKTNNSEQDKKDQVLNVDIKVYARLDPKEMLVDMVVTKEGCNEVLN